MTEQEALTAAIHEEVALQAHDPIWSQRFIIESERLHALLPDTFIDIQHIGSTAVPGLLAKPIVDLIAGVEYMEKARSLSDTLCANAYSTSAQFNQSLTDRQWFMRWNAQGHRTHHLHIVVHGGQAWQTHLQFRDILRAQPVLAARYQALKIDLAKKYTQDREAYTDAKAAYIKSVLQSAA